MKTPDEIKKVLEHCIETSMGCHMCDYVIRCLKVVRGKPIMQDALALIRQLEAKDEKQRQRIEELEAQFADAKLNHQHTIDIAEKQREQIGKLKKVIVRISIEKKGLESIIRGFPDVCRYCKNNGGEFCKGNPDAWGTCFEWIGIP